MKRIRKEAALPDRHECGRKQQHHLSAKGESNPPSPGFRAHARRHSPSNAGADEEDHQRDDRTRRRSPGRARGRKSQENYVARHIRGKDMAQREKAHGIDHAGDRRQGEESAEHISFGRGGCHKLFRHIALFVHRRALNTVITILGR